MRTIAVLLLLAASAATGQHDDWNYDDTLNLIGTAILSPEKESDSLQAGFIYFSQRSSNHPLVTLGIYLFLENGTYIGLIHEANKLGDHCNETGKALASTNESGGPLKPLIAIPEFNYHQNDRVLGIGENPPSTLNYTNFITNRVLVLHRVPSSENFFEQALANGHHESDVICGLVQYVSVDPESKSEPKENSGAHLETNSPIKSSN